MAEVTHRAREARSQLVSKGRIAEDLLPEVIARSWQRCVDRGLDFERSPEVEVAGGSRLNEHQERSRTLLTHAQPVMESLYDQIRDTHSMVILTDATGMIMGSLGDTDFLSKARRVALQTGVSWDETQRGTNAIGTAVVERRPVLVHGAEHFIASNSFLTCSASPVHDPYGDLLGVLDVSGDHRSFHQHTMALVRMSAQMLENHLFRGAFPEALTLRFHARPEFIGTLCEGIAVFSCDGRLLAGNRSALFQLGLNFKELPAKSYSCLFDGPFESLFDQATTLHPVPLRTRDGVRVHARIEAPISPVRPSRIQVEPRPSRPSGAPRRDRPTLASLALGDARVEAAINKVRRVLGRDIPVLIVGETGTGKELFAQAIHNDGPRRGEPFVAVNCAAIPEGLIESELFGYEEGAFTGARRKGAAGKIQQADGGTLFLDEIGDMPLNLQARLLRVLQERCVTPLGSVKSYPVDINLVCATNRNLRDLIASGAFREDLYYRLNGLLVHLPALRDRTDVRALVQRLTRAECEDCSITVSEQVMGLFERHPWPGNIRQMYNLIRTAVAMIEEGSEIGFDHLPDDFLEDAGTLPPRSDPAAATAPAVQPAVVVAPSASLEEMEIAAIRQALEKHGGNVSAAARQLGISRNTLYRKLRPA